MAESRGEYNGAPDLDDGYTRIANELMEAIAHYPFSGAQLRIVLILIRQTYGYNKKADALAYSRIAELTGLHRITVASAMLELEAAKVVTRLGGGNRRAIVWTLNKYYRQWESPSVSQTANSESVSQTANSCKPTDLQTVSQPANKLLANRLTTKDRKTKKDRDAASPRTPAQPTPQQVMVGALADVWGVDVDTGPKGRIVTVAGKLLKAGYTPEQVTVGYQFGGWWYQNDWRGKRGDRPTPEQVGETIRQAVSSKPSPPPLRVVQPDGSVMMPVAGPNARR